MYDKIGFWLVVGESGVYNPLMATERPIQYYTVTDVAGQLSLSEKTIRRLINQGHLPAKRFGRQWRIKQADIEAYGERVKK